MTCDLKTVQRLARQRGYEVIKTVPLPWSTLPPDPTTYWLTNRNQIMSAGTLEWINDFLSGDSAVEIDRCKARQLAIEAEIIGIIKNKLPDNMTTEQGLEEVLNEDDEFEWLSFEWGGDDHVDEHALANSLASEWNSLADAIEQELGNEDEDDDEEEED